jgi:hypothetical protein
MYNYNQYTDLIKRLRKLSRLSQTTADDAGQTDLDKAAARSKDSLDTLKESFADSTSAAQLYKRQIDILAGSFGDLEHGLSVVSFAQEEYNASITKLVKEVTFFDGIEEKIAKTLKITTGEAYKQTQTYGAFLEKLNTTRDSLDKYRITLNGILPGQSANIAASKEYAETLLTTQQHLQDFQGLSADQAASYTLYTEGSGKNIAQQLNATAKLADAWEASTGLVGQYNVILTEISNMSADIRSEYSRTNGELELSVLKTKRLGMTMGQLDKIGTGLLNIEESVGKEIEFQLISGKRLVDAQGRSITNKFREAKLSGDSLKMTEAMTDVITEQGEIITGNNFLAKKALADSLGISVQELVVAKQRYDLTKKLEATGKYTKKELEGIEPGSEVEKKFTAALEHEVKIADSPEAKKQAEENLNALKELKLANKNLESPADKTARHLQNIVDNGIFMKMPKTTTTEKGKTVTTYLDRKEFDVDGLVKTIRESKNSEVAQNEGFLKLVGSTQSLSKLIAADKKLLGDLADVAPGFSILSESVKDLTKAIEDNFPLVAKILKTAGNVLPAGKEGKAQKYSMSFPHGPAAAAPSVEDTHDLSIDANGGPIVMSLKENRIFQGTKNDDVAMYPGAVDVATANNTTKNYNVTNNTDKVNYDKIGNSIRTAVQSEIGKLNIKPTINVSTDKNVNYNTNLEKIASMLQTAVSKLKSEPDTNAIANAIKTAFAGVEISVHVDPIKIDKEIKFRNTRINT